MALSSILTSSSLLLLSSPHVLESLSCYTGGLTGRKFTFSARPFFPSTDMALSSILASSSLLLLSSPHVLESLSCYTGGLTGRKFTFSARPFFVSTDRAFSPISATFAPLSCFLEMRSTVSSSGPTKLCTGLDHRFIQKQPSRCTDRMETIARVLSNPV
jgi:hypothetical protein